MTTTAVATGSRTMETAARPRRSLEELVDQLFEAMGFKEEPETAELSAPHAIHEARGSGRRGTSTARSAFSPAWTWRRRRRGSSAGLSPSGRGWPGCGSATGTPCSMARERAGSPPLFPVETGRWRSSRSWGCGGGPASSSRSAACGGCGPWGGLALDRLGERRGVAAALAL